MFWKDLKKPILALAPMYDVTDFAFREMFAKYGKPDVMFTEFVSTDGLDSKGKDHLIHHLKYSEEQRPIVAQIFGSRPEKFAAVGKLLTDMKFDGIDINMGCPVKDMIKQGSCSALYKNMPLAREIVRATKESTDLPVSVKIRIGDNKLDWKTWIYELASEKPVVMTIHLRTRKEMSLVPAHWEEMPQIMEFLEKEFGKERPLVIGNGDVQSLEQAEEYVKKYGCDGIMIGRGAFGSPWFFRKGYTPTLEERFRIAVEHARFFEKEYTNVKAFEIMKKHFKAYIQGFDGAAEVRNRVYECTSSDQIEAVLQDALSKLKAE